jgi:hypothetical protein
VEPCSCTSLHPVAGEGFVFEYNLNAHNLHTSPCTHTHAYVSAHTQRKDWGRRRLQYAGNTQYPERALPCHFTTVLFAAGEGFWSACLLPAGCSCCRKGETVTTCYILATTFIVLGWLYYWNVLRSRSIISGDKTAVWSRGRIEHNNRLVTLVSDRIESDGRHCQ